MNDDERHFWDIIESIPVCMLNTWNGTIARTRPMGANISAADGVWFLTDARDIKDDEIAAFPQVSLGFSDPSKQRYASLSGNAQVSNDREKIRALWSVPAQAWWDSPDDPNIRALHVMPTAGEFWEGPGRAVAYIKMAVAAATGSRPDMGENKKVAFR